MGKRKPSSFFEFLAEMKRAPVKRRLKAAFRRTPRPAKPKPQDENQP